MRMINYIIDIVVPAICTYLASDDAIIKWLIKKNLLSNTFNTVLFQRVCLLISILFTTFILNIKLMYHSYNKELPVRSK